MDKRLERGKKHGRNMEWKGKKHDGEEEGTKQTEGKEVTIPSHHITSHPALLCSVLLCPCLSILPNYLYSNIQSSVSVSQMNMLDM